MELDEAEEAEVVSATLADFVGALHARESGSDADGNPTSRRPARTGGSVIGPSAAWSWPRP